MNSRAFACLVGAAVMLALIGPNAQGNSAYLSSKGSSAVDAKGIRHRGSENPDKMPPWMLDRVKSVAPDYPYWDRARHNVGVGLFRLSVDLKTGAVTNVSVVESTGHPTLDKCAIAAFRQWRWRPGKWKEIETYCTFRMGTKPLKLPPGSVRLSQSDRSSNQAMQVTATRRTFLRSEVRRSKFVARFGVGSRT